MRRNRSVRTAGRAGTGAQWRAWLGIVALLFYSALPLVHHARAAAVPADALRRGVIVYELCTPDGLRLVEMPPADSDRKGDPAHRPYSCPICQTVQHAQAALPPVLWAEPALAISGVAVSPAPVSGAPARLVLVGPGPRGPPSIA